MATEATISSGIYSRYIEEHDKSANVVGKACPLFVPLVEEGLWEDPVTDEIAKRYLTELIDVGIDTLILGCTHYPMIRSTIGRIMGPDVMLVNPAYETAHELKRLLQDTGLESGHRPGLGTELYRFFVSDAADKFQSCQFHLDLWDIICEGYQYRRILKDDRYSKRHNKFLFPALAGAIYGSACKAENENF